jgi:hypothetical protein
LSDFTVATLSWEAVLVGVAERQGDRLEQLARTAAEQRQSIELLAQTMQLFVKTRG